MKHPALNIGLGGKVSSGNCFYRKLFTCPHDSTTAEKRRLDPLVHYEKKKQTKKQHHGKALLNSSIYWTGHPETDSFSGK